MSGKDFGPYQLVDLLGSGGMGEVWRAVDTRKDRTVALKIIGSWARGDEYVRRFRREAALVARLSAPNIVPVHDYGEIDGRLFIDMSLIDGVDLGVVLDETGRLAPDRATVMIGQVAGALDVAHASGLVHRDVKPSNVLVTGPWMGQDFIYLIDFGIARDDHGTTSSLAGGLIGTLAYMAPERFQGTGDRRSDIYATACMLYEMLGGRPPFVPPDGAHAVGYFFNAHLNESPPRLPEGSVPDHPEIDSVIARGMAKDPGDRFRTAGEFAAAVRDALGRSGDGRPAGGRRIDDAPTAVPVTVDPRDVTGPSGPGSDTADRAGGATALPAPGDRRRDDTRGPRARPARRIAVAVVATALVTVLGWALVDGRLLDRPSPVQADEAPAPPRLRPIKVVETLPAGNGVSDVAVAPDGRTAYAANLNAGSVSAMDLRTGRTSILDVDSVSPRNLAVSADGTALYVLDYASATVVVLDLPAERIVRKIRVGDQPEDIVLSPDGRRAYVSEGSDNTVAVVDIGTGDVEGHVSVGGAPSSLAVSSDGGRVFVAASDSDAVSVVDTTTERTVATVPVGRNPLYLAVSPDGRYAYVANYNSGSISVLDTTGARPPDSMQVDPYPSSVAVSTDGRLLYVSSGSGGPPKVTVIDTATRSVLQSVDANGEGNGGTVALTPDGSRLLVTQFFSGTVSVIDTGLIR